MPYIFKCAKFFVREQFREPIGVVWAFVAPIAYMVLTSAQDDLATMPLHTYVDKAALCLAYIALSVSFMGFGLYLVGRRESGFVRSFLVSPAKRRRFLLAQFLASFFVANLYGIAFLLVTSWFLLGGIPQDAWFLFVWFSLTCAVLMYGAMFFAALPLTFQSAGSVMSITMTVLVVAGLTTFALSAPGIGISYVNPFFTASRFIGGDLFSAKVFFVLLGQVALLTVLGTYGIARLRLNPEWSNR